MAWTSNISAANIRSGPFQIGVGAAGSEAGVGECDELELTSGYEIAEIKGGQFFGRESLIDAVVQGITARATFNAFQMDTTSLARYFALGTLSAGPTSKSLTMANTSIIGKSLLASAARVRFHKESEATLTVETQDIIFPKGIIIPAAEPIMLSGKETMVLPCIIIGFYDTSTGCAVLFSKDAA